MTNCVLPISGSYTLQQAWHEIRHALGHETIVPPRWLLTPAAEVRRSLCPNAMDTMPPLSSKEQYSILAQQCMDEEMDFCPSPPVYALYTAPSSCKYPMLYMAPAAQQQLVAQAQPPPTIPLTPQTQHKKKRCF